MNRILLAATVVALAGTVSQAGSVVLSDPGTNWRSGGSWNGGAFRAGLGSAYIGEYGGPGSTGNNFLTFCVEYDEHFNWNNTYNTSIGNAAYLGGLGGPSPDPLSSRTALMYHEFRNFGTFGGVGGLTSANLAAGGGSVAAFTQNLQLAIWASEQELVNDTIAANYALLSGDAKTIYDWAEARTNGSLGDGIADVPEFSGGQVGEVRILRLTTADGIDSQDQLTIVPLPPAGWAGLGSLAGVAGFGIIRRRRMQRA